MSICISLRIPTITLCVASFLGVVSYYLLKKNEEDEGNIEEVEFVKVGKIEELFIYPVKSMKGISVPYIECGKTGGSYKNIRDRCFMVVDRKTSLGVGGGKERKLILIEPSLKYDNETSSYILTLTCNKNNTSVSVNVNEIVEKGIILRAKVFDGGLCDGYDCGDEISNFIKEVLGSSSDLRLMYHSESLFKQRHAVIGPEYSNSTVSKGPHEMRYHEDAPYHIVTKESLNDLNKRYDEDDQIVVGRFRPSIFISGTKPYDEDYWKYIKVGSCIYEFLKPCIRCIQTTINPMTGEKHPNMEPIRELRKYRLAKGRIEKQYGKSPIFGIQVGIKNGGIINVGDYVYVNYKKVQF